MRKLLHNLVAFYTTAPLLGIAVALGVGLSSHNVYTIIAACIVCLPVGFASYEGRRWLLRRI